MKRVLPRLRVTASLGLLLLAGGVGMTWWMSTRPRLLDRPIAAAVAARQEPSAPVHMAATSRAPRAPVVAPGADPTPEPLAPVHAPSPAYPMEALRKERGGVVTLRVSVDGQGAVVHVAVARSSGDPALDASARTTMREWRFQAPASHEPVTFDYTVRFHITNQSS